MSETRMPRGNASALDSQTPGAHRADFQCLEPVELDRLLRRRRSELTFPEEFNLADNLVEILHKANEFVPSAAGSILLDNPLREKKGALHDPQAMSEAYLTFIATFGDRAGALLGKKVPTDRGIAGHTYRTGETYVTGDAHSDGHFFAGVDEQIDYTTLSLIAIPIRIDHQVCGVLELVNRDGGVGFTSHDRKLLEIFAGYISVSIQNVLDGRLAQEIAKKDNLTGLFNDRYLHIALSHAVEECRESGDDLAVLFLDLDFFKRVNDTHGHLAGSQVLREVGGLLRRLSRRPGTLAARYGGDEFVIVVPKLDLEEAVDLAEEIRTEVLAATFCTEPGEVQREPLNLSGQTCSVGVATLRQHIDEAQGTEEIKGTLLRLADAAMYVAKETGRNRTAVAGAPVRRRR